MNETIEKAREEVYHYAKNTAGGFATGLIDLFAKADTGNKFRLTLGFPFVAQAIQEWMDCEDTDEFKERYIK